MDLCSHVAPSAQPTVADVRARLQRGAETAERLAIDLGCGTDQVMVILRGFDAFAAHELDWSTVWYLADAPPHVMPEDRAWVVLAGFFALVSAVLVLCLILSLWGVL